MRILIVPIIVAFFVLQLNAQFKTIEPYLGERHTPDLSIPLSLISSDKLPRLDNHSYNELGSARILSDIRDGGSIMMKGNKIQAIKRVHRADTPLHDNPINAFLDTYRDLFNTGRGNVQIEKSTEIAGKVHYRGKQIYKGIEIYGTEATFHGSENFIDFYLGNFIQLPNEIDVSITLTEVDAWSILRTQLPVSELTLNAPKGVKRILSQNKSSVVLEIYPGADAQFKMVYHFEYFQDGLHKKEVFIDANTGEIFRQFDAYCKLHAHGNAIENTLPPEVGQGANLFGQNVSIDLWREGSTYYLIDASRPMFNTGASAMPNDPVGAIWTLTGNSRELDDPSFSVSQTTSNSPNWSEPIAVSAHQNAAKAYEYFLNTFNRNSINGAGGNIVSIIHVGNNLDNAFWNGQAMFYGNGGQAFFELARGLDVAGHEMSHGVVQSTANLEYTNESGAMNEAFADIFGAMIDREDWLIGEDVVRTNVFTSGALRSLQDPHNGGQSLNDPGYQPKFYSERFTGSQDNGGVHINSGIVNHTYYLFATDPSVGRSKAEQVFYTVLTQFLTRSSDFADLRAAAEEVVATSFGSRSAEFDALANAFNVTGIPGGGGQVVETELESNPGEEFVIVTDANLQGIFQLDVLTNQVSPLTDLTIRNRPSVTDDGSTLVFVDGSGQLRFMQNFPADLSVGFIEQTPQTIWQNVIISRDGNRLAATTSDRVNEIIVFDFVDGGAQIFTLFNPTFTDGVSTGEVLFSDAMEFDHSGEVVLYDAFNTIASTGGTADIEYWDIGLLEVWDNAQSTFGSGNIQKLFNNLPENTSIGNPTFSKNSPSIVSFDLIQDNSFFVLGMNIETNDVRALVENNTLGFPNFSTDDLSLVYDQLTGIYGDEQIVAILPLDDTKINPSGVATTLINGGSRALWYANGEREITSIEDIDGLYDVDIFPNPTEDNLNIRMKFESLVNSFSMTIHNVLGQKVYGLSRHNISDFSEVIHLEHLDSGIYHANFSVDNQEFSHKIQLTNK